MIRILPSIPTREGLPWSPAGGGSSSARRHHLVVGVGQRLREAKAGSDVALVGLLPSSRVRDPTTERPDTTLKTFTRKRGGGGGRAPMN